MFSTVLNNASDENFVLSQWTLCEKSPYSEFFWSVFSPNAGKYRPEKLRIQTLFMQWKTISNLLSKRTALSRIIILTLKKHIVIKNNFEKCSFNGKLQISYVTGMSRIEPLTFYEQWEINCWSNIPYLFIYLFFAITFKNKRLLQKVWFCCNHFCLQKVRVSVVFIWSVAVVTNTIFAVF